MREEGKGHTSDAKFSNTASSACVVNKTFGHVCVRLSPCDARFLGCLCVAVTWGGSGVCSY